MKARGARALGGVAVLLAIGVAGCTPSGSSDGAATVPGSAVSGSGAAGGGSTAVTTPSPADGTCELSGTSTLTTQDEVTVIVELTDAGSGSCDLQGSPEATFLDAQGARVPIAVQAGSGEQFPGTPVEVDPGGHAYLSFLTDTTGSCGPTGATTMVIAVPGAPNNTRVDVGSTSFCPTSDDLPPQAYPVTLQPTTLT